MTPKVSIITTVYDRVDCLARCLRAVGHSEFTDLEQIVVSDAPPPPVLAAIARLVEHAGPRVRHLNLSRRTNNWGRSPARTGLRAAVGDYVCFLSDDNAYLPGHLAPLVRALDLDPGLGFVYSSCQYAGRKELRWAPPAGARIDLGQPLFRRLVLRDEDLEFDEFAWDWRLIGSLMERGVRWQHVDELSFIFRLAAYPALVKALA